MNAKQRTISKKTQVSGIGLHKGLRVTMTLYPAPQNTGIIFHRTDINTSFSLSSENVVQTPLCTVLKNGEHSLSTTEHFMAALSSLGIDNLFIDIDSSELPILDGSSMPFLIILKEAGIKDLPSPKKMIKVMKPIEVSDGEKWAKIEPYNGFEINFEIDFEHPIISSSNQSLRININDFHREISRARTFGFSKDIDMLKANNLAIGGSINNAIILDEFNVINPDGLRYDDEFVRHKILDVIGDLYMHGHQILGMVSAYKSGHALNNKLLRELINNSEAWEFVTSGEDEKENSSESWNPLLELLKA